MHALHRGKIILFFFMDRTAQKREIKQEFVCVCVLTKFYPKFTWFCVSTSIRCTFSPDPQKLPNFTLLITQSDTASQRRRPRKNWKIDFDVCQFSRFLCQAPRRGSKVWKTHRSKMNIRIIPESSYDLKPNSTSKASSPLLSRPNSHDSAGPGRMRY